MKKWKIKTRMLVFSTVLSSFLFTIFVIAFASFEIENTIDEYEQLARQTANTISFMPAIADAIVNEKTDELEGQIERIRLQVQHPLVSVVNDDGTYVHNTNATSSGEDVPGAMYDRTLMYGSYQNDSEQLHIQIIAPIYQQVEFNGERLVGAVKVEYPSDIMMASITDKFMRLGFVAFASLIVLVLGISLLARNIREDTFGLEPVEIASKFTEREAMLESVKEGIIAINTQQEVTLINPSARMLIQHHDDEDQLVRDLGLLDVINGETYLYDEERFFKGHPLIANLRPMYTNMQLTGAICSFRSKTDMRLLQQTIDQMKSYADGLRAQTHEFKNKLYVIMSLVQLEQYEEAIRFIEEEAIVTESFLPKLNQIQDSGIQAILLAEMGKASEKNITIVIEDSSSLEPTHIPISSMTTMLGNVIDNAIDAVIDEKRKRILIYMTDVGEDIVIDVEDSGKGIPDHYKSEVLRQGYSDKGEGRGYGLYNVEKEVRRYNGSLEIADSEFGGASVSLIIPKRAERKMK
ncbi:hypothetical protein DH09_14340 [Bacillaceae bacterium JMAK1]|nr:hypothetical protein DH09_14340 [Bacillaceae bacterium JMAK1]